MKKLIQLLLFAFIPAAGFAAAASGVAPWAYSGTPTAGQIWVFQAGGFWQNGSLSSGSWSGLTTNGLLQATSATTVASTLTPSGLTSLGVGSLTGVTSLVGAVNMTIGPSTGNSRTLALQSTTSGGVATTFLMGNADQSTTFASNVTGNGRDNQFGGNTANANLQLLSSSASGAAAYLSFRFDSGTEYARVQAQKNGAGTDTSVYITAADAATSVATIAQFNGLNKLTTLAGNLTVSGTGVSTIAGSLEIDLASGNVSETLKRNGTANLTLLGNGTDAYFQSGTGMGFILKTNGTTAMTGSTAQVITFPGAVASISPSTGTVIISGSGGLGVGGAVWIGSTLNVAGATIILTGTGQREIKATSTDNGQAAFVAGDGGANAWTLYKPNGAATMNFYVGGADRMVIGTSGAITLGGASSITAASSTDLTLNAGSGGTKNVTIGGGAGGLLLGTSTAAPLAGTTNPFITLHGTDGGFGGRAGGIVFVSQDGAYRGAMAMNDGSGDLQFYSGATPTEGFRLTRGLNLLIGTTTDISGTGNLAVAGGTVIATGPSATGSFQANYGSISTHLRADSVQGSGVVGTYSNHSLKFFTNSATAGSVDTSGNWTLTGNLTAGDISTATAGKTLLIKSGSNAKAGTFTLSSGAATVSNTSITANSVVACTVKTSSGTLGTGTPEIVITAGTGFTATGIATDNSTYNFVVFEVN